MTHAEFLVLEGLSRQFAAGAGIRDVSLSLGPGEILALLGPSGSGKTTTLRLLAGFETPDRGRILVSGDDVTRVPAVRRRFGMVFQHYALFPHLSVGGNVAFGLEDRRLTRAEIGGRVATALESVDLGGYQDRRVESLSGGQQQRVALARALAPEPRVLLLDEPLSNLDPALRERTRQELRHLIQRIGITTVLVTHEQEEAFDLADRVAVLELGLLDQVGTPEELYERPATPFVAGFIGRATLIPAQLVRTRDQLVAEILPDLPELPLGSSAGGEGPATIAIRPEGLALSPAGESLWTGAVVGRRFLGASALYRVALAGAKLEIEAAGGPRDARVGEMVGLRLTGVGIHAFPRGKR